MGAEGRVEIDRLCDRCMRCAGDGDDQTLYNLAHMDDRTLQGLMREGQHSLGGLHEKAWEYVRARMKKRLGAIEAKKEELQDLKEAFSYRLLEGLAAGADVRELLEEYLGDETRRRLEEELAMMDHMEEAVEPEDIRNSLKEYMENDLIEVKGDEVRITPKGAGALARYVLRRIWEHLASARAGTHAAKEEGFGMSDGFAYRKYEYGDEFFRIDQEKTLLSALEKGRMRSGRIEFEAEDLIVRETVFDTRLCVGLVVDESGSMSGDKIHAAVDISLALSELVKRNARDKMRLFLFSNRVRETASWDMLNAAFSGGTTDIRGALRKFRTATAGERAERQVYLVTDTEPNSEDGKYIGFEKAALGVLQEAILYQRKGITLNIIMLDSTSHLREFASALAKRNLGRVFFATPKDLGKVVVEDYLRTRKRQNRRMAV
jgi:uncharacterized protein with von Willebrand factor type A (vWA) domain